MVNISSMRLARFTINVAHFRLLFSKRPGFPNPNSMVNNLSNAFDAFYNKGSAFPPKTKYE